MCRKHLNLISSKCSDVKTDLTVEALNTHREEARGHLSLSLPILRHPPRPAPRPCLHLRQLCISVL